MSHKIIKLIRWVYLATGTSLCGYRVWMVHSKSAFGTSVWLEYFCPGVEFYGDCVLFLPGWHSGRYVSQAPR